MIKLFKNILIGLLLLGAFAQVNADELFIFQKTELKSEDGKIAKLFLGVPVTVKEDMGTKAKVLIKGYKFDEVNVYSSKAKELLIATLEKGFKVVQKAGNAVELEGIVEKELLTENASEIWEEHEEFYFEMCTQCHAAANVPHHTMIEWEALFAPMKGFAKLDEEESSYLLRYLKSNASNGLIKNKH